MDAKRSRPHVRSAVTPTRSGTESHHKRWRRHLLALAICGLSTSMTGCAASSMSLASLNPFGSKAATASSAGETPSMLASTTNTIGKAATGVGTATKNAFSKTSSTIGGWFGRGQDAAKIAQADVTDDPLALGNMPEKGSPDVFVANGQLWESTGNLTKAMESYTKALESEPENGPALTSIARLHFREENFPQAAQFFQKAIEKQPTDAALYNDLGLTLSKLDQHELASQTITRALQLAPGTSRYANNLASVHYDAGKPDDALEVLIENNKPAVAHFNMAYLHYKNGKAAPAQQHLQTAMSIGSTATDPATQRAVERSREMLAQISPGNVPAMPGNMPAGPDVTPGIPGGTTLPTAGPATQIAGTPDSIKAAAGPIATVAAAPAHSANQPVPTPQRSFGPAGTKPTLPAGMGLTVTSESKPTSTKLGSTGQVPAKPVSFKDPRSYMSPQMPAGAPTQNSATSPGPVSMPPVGPVLPGDPSAKDGTVTTTKLPSASTSTSATKNPFAPPTTDSTPAIPQFVLPKNFSLPPAN
ncbi:MAG: tetratricopeptide repeat protein [Planctomycetota bacterium]